MRGNRHPMRRLLHTGKLEWKHLLLTGPKKKRKWRTSFLILMLIANNSIFKSIMSQFFSQVNNNEGVLPNDDFGKKFILQFLKNP